MNKFAILLKREVWEFKVGFVYLPIVVASLCAFFLITGISALQIGGESITIQADIDYQDGQVNERYDVDDTFDSVVGQGLLEFASRSRVDKERALNKVYLGISAPLMITLWLMVISYLVTSLYQERKDRSILFWKSMPVSDFATVMSKIVAALVVAPSIYLLCCMALHVVLLLVSSISAMSYDVAVWSTLWAPANIITRWLQMAGYFVIVSLWCLPFYTWVLLVSSKAKSVPLVWIVGLPLVLMLLEAIFTNTGYVKDFIGDHVAPISISRDLEGGLLQVFNRVLNLELVVSVLIGCCFLYGAVYFRGKADEL